MDETCHLSDSETLLDPSRQGPQCWTQTLSGLDSPPEACSAAEVRNLLQHFTDRPSGEAPRAHLRAWRLPWAALVMTAAAIVVLIDDVMRRGRVLHYRGNMLAAVSSSVVLDQV